MARQPIKIPFDIHNQNSSMAGEAITSNKTASIRCKLTYPIIKQDM